MSMSPNWFNTTEGIYTAEGGLGNRPVTQADMDAWALQEQQQQQVTQAHIQQWIDSQRALGDNTLGDLFGAGSYVGPTTRGTAGVDQQGLYNWGDGLQSWVPMGDSRFIPAPQHNDSFFSGGGFLGGIVGTTKTHLEDTAHAYEKDPERAVLGINTPGESQAWGALLGKDYTPTVNQTGGPTQQTYDNAAASGYSTGPTETGHTLAPAVVGIGAASALAGGVAVGEGTGAAIGGAGTAEGVGTAGAGTTAGTTAGPLGTTSGAETLTGSTASSTTGSTDTLGTTQGNNGMWDFVDQNSVDPFSDSYVNDLNTQYGNPPSTAGDPNATGAFDQNGSQGVFDSNGNPLYNSDPNYQQLVQKYGSQIAQRLWAATQGGRGSQGKGILDTVTGDPLQAGFNSLPFLYSMYEANRQGNQVNPILAKLSGLADTASSNTNGLVASATGPFDRETMAGRDALMSDQSMRGVRGSSFGDQGIASYDLLRGRGRGELVGSTQAKALGLTGDLLNSQLKGTTNAATSRNLLIGAGLSASGRLFQPQQDPFGLANLLALSGNNNPFGTA